MLRPTALVMFIEFRIQFLKLTFLCKNFLLDHNDDAIISFFSLLRRDDYANLRIIFI